jgi:outer membrane protein assembly factor BamB
MSANAWCGDWAQWRGPHFNGSSDETELPLTWSTTENVRWSAPMPGISAATPVVSGDHVFVVSNDQTGNLLYGLCFDRKTGKELWRKLLVEDATYNSRNTMATCSPVADGKHVYFLFGNGRLFALDLKGNTVWSLDLAEAYGSVAIKWVYSSSPLLFEKRLYVPVMRDEDSYLICLSPDTGKEIWRVIRETDAVSESRHGYTTPVPYSMNGRSVIVVGGGDYINGHDALTGEDLWRHEHNPTKRRNWRLIPSPVIAGSLVTGTVPRGGAVFAIKPTLGANMAFEETQWRYDARSTDSPTPLLYKDRLYVVSDSRKTITSLDAKTGKALWVGDLGGDYAFWASPVAGAGNIYLINENGDAMIVAAKDEFEIVSRIPMGGNPCTSTIALAHGNLFIRTGDTLYCIGKR